MKALLPTCLIAYFFATAAACFASETPGWHPSRKAWNGCVWEPFVDKEKGIGLWYQNCRDPSVHYVLSWRENRLEQHRPADDRTFNGPVILELYGKSAKDSIEQAIADRFIGNLSEIERKHCHVEKSSAPSGIERYRIVPAASYEKKIVDAFNKENPAGGVPYGTICGEHGQWTEGEAYFEYHPAESATKFIYVIVGQDEPLFDENSIALAK